MTRQEIQADGTESDGSPDSVRLVPRIGTPGIVFNVVGFLAPLSAMAGTITLVIGYGNGLGAPLAYLTMGVMLALFSVGFMALVRNVRRPGAFYSYIAASLGRRWGLGASGISMCLYLAGMIGISSFGAVQAKSLVANLFGVEIPWWVYSLVILVIAVALCYRGIEMNIRIVGFIVVIELLVIMIFNFVTIARGGPDGYMTQSFTWDEFTSGSLSIGLLFAVCTVNGFEATAIFREEAREPQKTVPRATYIVVGGSAIFYAFSSWCLIVAVGNNVVADSAADPASVFVNAMAATFGNTARDVLQVLILTSVMASAVSITNVATRYTYSLGVDRVLAGSLEIVHRRYGTPHRALLAVSAVAASIIVIVAIVGQSPVELYTVLSGVGIIGFEFLLFAVSLATFVYFRKNRADHESAWSTFVAPLVTFVVLAVLLGFTLTNMSLLVGDPSILTPVFGGAFLAAFVAGFAYASWAAKYKPDVYDRIGRAVE
ncbi:APC family permease [Rhodococcus erythropolis]|uniref:APC family permease n=2 Tax=Rhodococcus erythropolis group TaxID=2840174 RepID=UPI001BEAA085|nr:APC family permease [Rhodococcus erythropolis]MBT2266080.1 APC family permease [Rhodococcus erythropolis]